MKLGGTRGVMGDRSVGIGVHRAVWVHLKYLVLVGNVLRN